ncbi:SPRY domain-containing protein [Entamoeba marina]
MTDIPKEIEVVKKFAEVYLKQQQKEYQELNESITEDIEKTFNELKEMIPSHVPPSLHFMDDSINCVSKSLEIEEYDKKFIENQKQKILSNSFELSDIITVQFIDSTYQIPRQILEKLHRSNDQESLTESITGKSFGKLLSYLRGEKFNINEGNKTEVIEIFDHFGVEWQTIPFFLQKYQFSPKDINTTSAISTVVTPKELLISFTGGHPSRETFVLQESVVRAKFLIKCTGEHPTGSMMFIGCAEKDKDILPGSNGFMISIQNGSAFSETLGHNKLKPSFHITNNDIIEYVIHLNNTITFTCNNQTVTLENANGVYYPVVLLGNHKQVVSVFDIFKTAN